MLYKDIAGSFTRLDYLFNAVQVHTKDFITYVAQNKHTLIFWVKLCGIVLLAMGCYFTKRHIRKTINNLYELLLLKDDNHRIDIFKPYGQCISR